mmetsp:Transcript_46310/g.104376  ORF Transcript_46310/g.104376 Transcript_46310/m.104376 type:complete len:270 (+) Transcript_46310:1627-2436(+)
MLSTRCEASISLYLSSLRGESRGSLTASCSLSSIQSTTRSVPHYLSSTPRENPSSSVELARRTLIFETLTLTTWSSLFSAEAGTGRAERRRGQDGFGEETGWVGDGEMRWGGMDRGVIDTRMGGWEDGLSLGYRSTAYRHGSWRRTVENLHETSTTWWLPHRCALGAACTPRGLRNVLASFCAQLIWRGVQLVHVARKHIQKWASTKTTHGSRPFDNMVTLLTEIPSGVTGARWTGVLRFLWLQSCRLTPDCIDTNSSTACSVFDQPSR